MLYEQVIPLLYDSYAFITTFRACHYWGDKEECKFCDINHNLREIRKLEGDHVTADAIKDKDRVADVLAAMVEEPDPSKRLITIIMTGGSIVRKVRGGPDNAADFNVPFVEAIRDRIGSRIPIVMITESQPMDRLQRLVDAGITSHNANLGNRWFNDIGRFNLIYLFHWAAYLSTRAIFLLYQFIKADVERLKIR